MRQIPAASSGLDTPPARAALLFVWTTGLVHGLLMHAFDEHAGLVAAAYALAVCAAVAVTRPPRGRLAVLPTLVVLAAGASIAAVVLTSPRVSTIVWLFDFASYPVALLIPRGRPLVGGAGVTLLIGAGILWSLTTSQLDPSWVRMVSGPFVAGAVGAIWWETLRRIVARETRARSHLERTELLSNAARDATRSYHARLAHVADESEAVLREIAESDHLDAQALRRVALVEGRIRDRLRAADLYHPRLATAVDAARERGVQVLLIGSGGTDDRGIGDELADRLAQLVSSPGLESLTLRRLPPRRHAAVSAVGRDIHGVVRAALDGAGEDAGSVEETRTRTTP